MNPDDSERSATDVDLEAADTTADEIDLSRRLGRLAADARIDPAALDRIRDGARIRRTRRPPHPRVMLATAAGILAVASVAAVALTGRDSRDDGDVETTGDPPASVVPSTTPTTTPTTTSTTVDEHDPDGAPSTTTQPSAPAGGDDLGDPSTIDDGATSGTPETADPAPRTPSEMTLAVPEYSVEIVRKGSTVYFRRTDDVGSNADSEPDAYGHVQSSGWPLGGATCLTSGGGTFTFPGAAAHTFTYGLVGSGIARIDIVYVGGERHSPPIRPSAGPDGFRSWLVERPAGAVDRIEGLDADGQVVASITEIGGGDDFGYSITTC